MQPGRRSAFARSAGHAGPRWTGESETLALCEVGSSSRDGQQHAGGVAAGDLVVRRPAPRPGSPSGFSAIGETSTSERPLSVSLKPRPPRSINLRSIWLMDYVDVHQTEGMAKGNRPGIR